MTLPIDEDQPSDTRTATLALGCFWGPDARYGALPAVVRTRSGYAGGDKPDPTYHGLGNHTETVQIEYDPELLGFEDLLDLFWAAHDASSRRKRQYASIIFVHDTEQRTIAEEHLEEHPAARTEIQEFNGFTRAEEYHQKYRLRQHTRLMDLFKDYGPDAFTDSTAAARLNGYAAGYGSPEQVKKNATALGLDEDTTEFVTSFAGSHDGGHC